MNTRIAYPFELTPSAQGTRLTFQGGEEGEWNVELDVHEGNASGQRRVKLVFGGVTQARVNDDLERKLSPKLSGARVLMQVEDSSWVQSFLSSYVEEFGTALLPVVNNMKHFIVRGHESTIGLLARRVDCVPVR